ncbi:MAG: radical SAM-associated putative lipoprotein [Prevotellaceae bacterium]|jgi:putative lipoprotein (rSAM/lipoprotein system)|nr:radical SAM-associated putative lipoprotein [Prevotellaceae bacterium]
MKKVNHSVLKCFNVILVALLGLFGFSNCGHKERVEYGTSELPFAIKGKVTSKADGTPIQGIRVKRNPLYMIAEYGAPTPDFSDKSPVYTDKNGNYIAPISDTIPEYAVVFEDIDGEQNGAFNDTTIIVKFNTGENVDVTLSKKN